MGFLQAMAGGAILSRASASNDYALIHADGPLLHKKKRRGQREYLTSQDAESGASMAPRHDGGIYAAAALFLLDGPYA